MKPVAFKEQNCVYAKDQPQYQQLPVYRTEEGRVISCWKLTWWERVAVLLSGRIWWSVLTFNHPLQPQLPLARSPFRKERWGRSEERPLALEPAKRPRCRGCCWAVVALSAGKAACMHIAQKNRVITGEWLSGKAPEWCPRAPEANDAAKLN